MSNYIVKLLLGFSGLGLGALLYILSYNFLSIDIRHYGYVVANIFLVPSLFSFVFLTADWGLKNEHKWGRGGVS